MENTKLYVVAVYILAIFFNTGNAAKPGPSPKFPAILIFGDSTNYPGQKATGRFSDGELVPDMLASALKIKEAVPPFLDPNLSDAEVITGLQASLPRSKMAYIDVYDPLADMIKDPNKNDDSNMWKNPKFIFWDAVHPSSSTYRILFEHFEKFVLPKFL
ncbi:hypothetical protein POTOM_031281 [Populus tomentosa]|uniref:Uncharacterized protein n=1 Tax=Populus tomentosa TaxID=118781 RepID=A0A8X7Z2B6_POPTO|nr:hypothetical protein POTOM_031281 [Populus tomentosa]